MTGQSFIYFTYGVRGMLGARLHGSAPRMISFVALGPLTAVAADADRGHCNAHPSSSHPLPSSSSASSALRFFAQGKLRHEKPAEFEAIKAFIQRSSERSAEHVDLTAALERHTREQADDTREAMRTQLSASEADASNYGKRGKDLRKATGDVYEALVGMLLLELGGDVDATWGELEAWLAPR